jgi:hypothetical protein
MIQAVIRRPLRVSAWLILMSVNAESEVENDIGTGFSPRASSFLCKYRVINALDSQILLTHSTNGEISSLGK